MKLRFNLTEPIDTGSPDYIICNQASSFISFTNLELVLKIDGTNIINTIDLAGVSFPIAPITTTNGYIVSASIENTNYIVINIDIDNVWDSTTASFIVNKIGYWSFNKTFEIYGYDLGKNPNLTPITDSNPDFNLVLINKINNEVSGVQTKAYSSLIAYRKPFTSELHYYKSNSGSGEITYQNTDLEQISTSVDGFLCIVGAYGIKQICNLYEYNNTGRTLLSTCTSNLINLLDINNFPTFGSSTTCVNCDAECIVLNTENTTTTNIDYSLLSTYYIDDIEVNPYLTQNLIYRLIDFTGNIIDEISYSFNINPLPFTYIPTDYLYNFSIPEVGDYIIQVEVSVANLYKCIKNYPIFSCNFYEIKNTECNEYTVYNKSFEDFTLIISELQDDKTFLEVSSVIVPALDNVVITHTSDNVYTYTVAKDEIDYIYIVVNYCNLRTCLLIGLTNLICPKTGECIECRAKDYYDFNALIINAHTYFNMLNSEYNFNYMYEALSVNKINELYELKSFLTRFEEYCLECNKVCNCS